MAVRGIAISGKAGSGKTTIAQAIDETLDMNWRPSQLLRLADGIYAEAYEQGMDRSKKDRPLLQSIGDTRTVQDPSYYARILAERRDALDASVIAVVDDLRKVVEAEYLRQKGFVLVRLDASPQVRQDRLLARDGITQQDSLEHWTETDLDHYDRWDIKLPNNGAMTPDQLATFIVWTLGLDLRAQDGE